MKTAKKLFLDFDGVLCDSLQECFASSAVAYFGYQIDNCGPALTRLWAELSPVFTRLRPYIREGADYLLLHRMIQENRLPHNQSDFDQALEGVGATVMQEFKTKLYQVREAMLAHRRADWLAQNPLYPGLRAPLVRLAGAQDVYILSTKKAEFIAEILLSHQVPWSLDRIIYTGSRKKLDIIRAEFGAGPAQLIDDQIDHLDFGATDVDCRLAEWGYIKPEWLAQPGVRMLDLRAFIALLQAHPV